MILMAGCMLVLPVMDAIAKYMATVEGMSPAQITFYRFFFQLASVLPVLIALNGMATAMYMGSQLGPGPRDGFMTGLARVTGRSIRLVRTAIEVAVVILGWALGGKVGVSLGD